MQDLLSAGLEKGWADSPETMAAAAELLVKWVRSGEDAKSDRRPRWSRFRDFYYNQPAMDTWPDSVRHRVHIPVVQPKTDALVSHVVQTLCGQAPYCRAKAGPHADSALLRRKEEIVQAFAETARMRERMEEACAVAAWSNAAHLFVYRDEHGVRIESHEPDEIGVYPAFAKDDKAAVCVWRNLVMTRAQAVEKYGEALAVAPSAGGAFEDKERLYGKSAPVDSTQAVRREDEPVKLHECFVRDAEGSMWAVVVCQDPPTVAKAKKIGDKGSPCMVVRGKLKPEAGNGYWPLGSVAADLQDIQMAVDRLASWMMDGLQWSIQGGGLSGSYGPTEGHLVMQPGAVLTGSGLEGAVYQYPRPDLNFVLPTLQYLLNYADVVARVSVSAQGGQMAGRQTATEVNAIVAGQQAAFVSYMATFAPALEQCYALVAKHVEDGFVELLGTKAAQQCGMTIEDRDAVFAPCSWSVVAQSPANTPESQQNMLAGLMSVVLQAPQAGGDPYVVFQRMLEEAKRQGLMDTTDVQMPRGPEALAAWVAQQVQLPPELVAAALQAAKQSFDAQAYDRTGLEDAGGPLPEEAGGDAGSDGQGPIGPPFLQPQDGQDAGGSGGGGVFVGGPEDYERV